MSNLILGDDFFAPAPSDLVDNLIGRYKSTRDKIENFAGVFNGSDGSEVIPYFLRGNQGSNERYIRPVADIFKLEGAIANLNASYWQQALSLTDVYEYMPQKRRDEWNDQIREMKTPEFEEETVRPTIMSLLNSRQKFFSERVDGIFRALSGEHVTNRPEGFSKRMILYVMGNFGLTHSNVGYLNDLRTVIAKFMGRDQPGYSSTDPIIKAAYRKTGQWLTIDGGALRIRCYLKGTAHLEVHPDMAWRLNCVLASLYPAAIPAEFRQKPKKRLKDFTMMERPLPFAVINVLVGMKKERIAWMDSSGQRREGVTDNPHSRCLDYSHRDNAVQSEVEKVLAFIGGVKMSKNGHFWFEFDYDPDDVISEIVASGCIPEHKSHQFYPTPDHLAQRCIDLAGIEPHHSCLEPSAGHGAIADLLNEGKTTCVEISPLNCKVLESKGHRVFNADFLKWSEQGGCFDRIVMNPPFSEGRALAHLNAAASLTKTGSRLVAILPPSMKSKDLLPGWSIDWSEIITNEFANTSVSVVILTAERGY
ncbi:DUF4942 domain-containing protein [Serratia symbiotica]|uniref:DUF4942 domain-containing protein n=1 Tax=Serratia symbiotica TaxID=138074 RepID=UPI00135FA95B|nr:DUF4942 domain-containing protein [Serratia symbiotica]MBQ0956455.1 DUF4942 domain-containing protein [Serratia symbiotica]